MLEKLTALLFPMRPDEKQVCATPDDTFLALLFPMLVPVTRPSTVRLLPFPDVRVKSAVHESKYHGTRKAQHLLASALAAYLAESEDGFGTPVIVTIPLGQVRRRERGFNQVDEVVRTALRIGTAPEAFVFMPDVLARTRETTSQTTLSRKEREANMHGAFRAVHPLDPARTYLLIDDVVTTGATLQAGIDALKAGGAVHIIPVALAH